MGALLVFFQRPQWDDTNNTFRATCFISLAMTCGTLAWCQLVQIRYSIFVWVLVRIIIATPFVAVIYYAATPLLSSLREASLDVQVVLMAGNLREALMNDRAESASGTGTNAVPSAQGAVYNQFAGGRRSPSFNFSVRAGGLSAVTTGQTAEIELQARR